MIKTNENNERMCSFYASDYHFEMISLPYITKQIKEREVIILTENNLENTLETLLARMNLSEEEKDKVRGIDWKNNDFLKFKAIKQMEKQNKDKVIFIKGKENYIKNVNKNIEGWIQNENTQIIDCYDMNEIGNDVSKITDQYQKVLNTTGKIVIQKNR